MGFPDRGFGGPPDRGRERAASSSPRRLCRISAHLRHRVEWTDADQPTVWLALHLGDSHLGDEGDRSMCNLYSMTTSQQAIRDPRRRMRDLTGNMPTLPGDLSRLFRADRPQPAGRGARTGHGALGNAVAGLRHEGQEDRSWRHQHPQRQIAALAAMARRRKPLHRRRSPASRRTNDCRMARGRRSGSRSTKRARSPSSPASGRVGPRSERSRKARRPMTSSPS